MAGSDQEPGLQTLTFVQLVDAPACRRAAMRAERGRGVQLAADATLTIVDLGVSLIGLSPAHDLGERRAGSQHLAKLQIADLEKVHDRGNRPSR